MERAKGRTLAIAVPPEETRGAASGAEAQAALMLLPALLAAVRQLTAARLEVLAARTPQPQGTAPAHTGRVAYAVCSRAPPFLGFLCALFPEHEFHVYDPAPGLSAQPFSQGGREVPAWLYRHEFLQADRVYWEQRGGETIVFLGESASLLGMSAEDPLADEILASQCQRRCVRCAVEIKTWLAYVRGAPAPLQAETTGTKAVVALMAAARHRYPAHGSDQCATLETQVPSAASISTDDRRRVPAARPAPTKFADTEARKALPIRKAPSDKARSPTLATEPPTSKTESPASEEEGPLSADWERLSAEMLAFSADSNKKAAARGRGKLLRGALGRGRAGRARSLAKD